MPPTPPFFEAGDESTGFGQAEALEALVVEDHGRPHEEEIEDLVHLADFLAPELHRAVPSDAADVITDWADGDPELLQEAATVARQEHHDESAELLHQAAEHARAA